MKPLLLAVALALAAHGTSLGHAFVWDDEAIVVNNPDTASPRAIGRVLLSPDQVAPYYRPLNRASYLLDHAVFGMDPRGFHAVNLALHAGSVAALYLVGLRLFGSRTPAWIAAALLAVHPIHVEAVSFVSARNNLLSLLFSLIAVAAFLDADRRDSGAKSVMSAFAFLAALGSKEPALMVLPLMALWPWLRGLPPLAAARRSGTLLWPHFLAVAGYLAARSVALDGAPAAAVPAAPLLERLSWNLATIPGYLGLCLFPKDLTIFHVVRLDPPMSLGTIAAWGVVAAAVVALASRRSLPATFGALWLGFHLLPIANLVAVPSVAFAERFFHAAAAGLWIVAADLAMRIPGSRRRVAIVATVLLLLAARTVDRTLDWRDDVRLFSSAVAVDPRSAVALENLGVALKDGGDLAGARAAWDRALAAEPDRATTLAQLGTLAAVEGDLAEAERRYLAALRRDPSIAAAWDNLALVYERTGRPSEAARARGRRDSLSGPPR